jgi:2-oxo-4-hydroxy-4-carboxy-5-ureidoimidazoline decarboxylase
MPMGGLAGLSKAEFIERFGPIFEHSPWVVEAAWERSRAAQAPFADAGDLHAAFMAEVTAAGAAAQLALINAHPALATNVDLTEASQSEQQGAGLKHLTAQEFERFAALNAAYRKKFGFPFIICVRLNTKASILAAFEARLAQDAAAEREAAIAQIGLITKLRLQDVLEGSRE